MNALQQLTQFGVARSGNTFLFAASAVGSSTVSLVGNALVSGAMAIGTNANSNAPLELHAAPANWGTMRITPLISGSESSLAFSRTATGLLAAAGDAWAIGQGVGGNGGGTLSITSFVPGSTYLNALNILPTGSVGIGKLPAAMLDIGGDTNVTNNLMIGNQLSLLGASTASCMLSLFSSGVRPGTSSTSFYGFGMGNDLLKYQGASLTSVHAFCGSTLEFARVTPSGLGVLQPNVAYTLDVNGSARYANNVFKAYSYNLTTAVSGAGNPNVVKRVCVINYLTDAAVFAEVTVLVKGFNIHMSRQFKIPLRSANDSAYQTVAPFFGDDSLGTGNDCQILVQNSNYTSSVIALRWILTSGTAARTPTFDVAVRVTGSNTSITDDATAQSVDSTSYAQYSLTPFSISNGTVTSQNLMTSSVTGTSASLTQITSATITATSLSSNFGTFVSISTGTVTVGSLAAQIANMTTLTVGTILNFSAGGSLGTNLFLSGTLTTPAASITSLTVTGSASIAQFASATITANSLSSNYGSVASMVVGTVTAASFSAQAANMSTLTVGTILNFSAGGSLGTNLFLTGTLTTPAAIITSLTVTGNASLTGILTAGTVTSQFASQTQGFTSSLSGAQFLFAAGSINALSVSTVTSGNLSSIYGSIGNLAVSGNTNVTGLLVNNVTGFLQARAYDDVATYAIVAGTVGQALPPAGLGRVAAASQTSSLNFAGASFGTLTTGYSVRIHGFIQATQTGTFSFQAVFRDGLTFWIGATKLVDSWLYLSGTVSSVSSMVLYAGIWAPITVEHATATTNEKLLIQWAFNGGTTLSPLTHGTGFNMAYEFAETPPVTLGNTYVSGQIYANDVVNMAAGASLQGSQYFSGYLSQLNNDAGYVSTLGSTITGTALMINGAYASVTGTLTVGTLIAGSVGAVVGIISTLNAGNARVTGPLTVTGIVTQSFSRTFDVTANGVGSIASYTGSTGCFNFDIDVLTSSNSQTFVAHYRIAANWNIAGSSWKRCMPLGAGNSNSDEYELQITSTNYITSFRLVHSSASQASKVTVNIVCKYNQNDPPTIADLTSSAQATDANWSTYAYLPTTMLTQRAGNVGINTNLPAFPLDVNGVAHASTILCDNTCTSGSLLNLPSVAMTSNSTAGFICTASGTNGNRQVYYLFDRTTATGWAGVGPYNGSSTYGQLYSGTVTTTVSGVPVAGEWVQLQCPSAYNIVSYTVTDTNQRASAWTIAGSNDASTWTLLDSRALVSVPAAATLYTTASSNIAFTYLRYIVTVVTGYNVADQAELAFTAGLGRIGINTSLPSFQLDVTGSTRITGSFVSNTVYQWRYLQTTATPSTSGANNMQVLSSYFTFQSGGSFNVSSNLFATDGSNASSNNVTCANLQFPYSGVYAINWFVRYNASAGENATWFLPMTNATYGSGNNNSARLAYQGTTAFTTVSMFTGYFAQSEVLALCAYSNATNYLQVAFGACLNVTLLQRTG